MILSSNEKRTLKALLTSRLLDYKKMFIVIISIMAGVVLISFITTSLQLEYSGSFSMTSSGVLNVGFITTIIAFCIAAFASSTKAEIGICFTFPINRKLYTLVNFIITVAGAFIFLAAISLLGVFELIIFKVLSGLHDNMILVNSITASNFFAGFWASMCYMILFTSISYFLGVCFSKNKVVVAVIFGLFFGLIIINPYFADIVLKGIKFFVAEPSLLIFSIKALLATFVLQLLAYIPLKDMEVKV